MNFKLAISCNFERCHISSFKNLGGAVPPPKFNVVRYHGVLAPSAAWRALVVPESEKEDPPRHSGCQATGDAPPTDIGGARRLRETRPRNYSWAELMRRVFSIDVLECPRCGGRMRILAAINPPDAIRKILDCLGLPSRPPPIARPRRGQTVQ